MHVAEKTQVFSEIEGEVADIDNAIEHSISEAAEDFKKINSKGYAGLV